MTVEPVTATTAGTRPTRHASGRLVLGTLAAGQFLMVLDSSVMNVSIASVANDLGTTVTGIQTAITLYTLVMAAFMITGGTIGARIGRRHAFSIGCVVYGAGSLTTALSPNVYVLYLGWSLLEGLGAALIMPAIVALVAANVPTARRAAAYGLIASASAIAVAAGPLIGGAVTTVASWRYVFAAEVVIVAIILPLARRIADPGRPGPPPAFDYVGALLSIAGLASVVFGVLRSAEWGWVSPRPDQPSLLGVSPTIWLILLGLLLLWLLLLWLRRRKEHGRAPLVDPDMFGNRQLSGGLSMFGMQYFIQAAVFFTIPLFLSVVLGLSALETGARLLPLSLALLVAAAGLPKWRPRASPRRVVRVGLLLMTAGVVILVAGLDPGADAAIVSIPLLLIGLGIGGLASQLGAVTVSAEPDERSAEVGGLQNTVTNLGASLGTALVGSVLIATLGVALIAGIEDNPAVPQQVKNQASVSLAGGAPFLSDEALSSALTDAGLSPSATQAIVDVNEDARLQALRVSLAAVAVIAVVGLFFTGRIPRQQPGSTDPGAPSGPAEGDREGADRAAGEERQEHPA